MPKIVFPMPTAKKAKTDFRFLIYTPKKHVFKIKKKHGLERKNYQ